MSDFLFPIIEIVLGIVLLFTGGEFFIQGAIFLSLILGIPQIVIGLTVVSLGTSSPESVSYTHLTLPTMRTV